MKPSFPAATKLAPENPLKSDAARSHSFFPLDGLISSRFLG
jgi:hypothetical protein